MQKWKKQPSSTITLFNFILLAYEEDQVVSKIATKIYIYLKADSVWKFSTWKLSSSWIKVAISSMSVEIYVLEDWWKVATIVVNIMYLLPVIVLYNQL